MLRPALEAFPAAHAWSVGASEGRHSVRLDTLDEGQTRLLACTPASPSGQGGCCDLLPVAPSVTLHKPCGAQLSSKVLHVCSCWLLCLLQRSW